MGAKVLGVDTGKAKQDFIEGFGAKFLDFAKTKDLVGDVKAITGGGAHAAVVTSGHPQAFNSAADMLRIGGTLCCVGIPPGDVSLDTPIAAIVIKGLRIIGNLVGSMKETLEAVDFVRSGKVKPHAKIREFKDLPEAYEMLEKGDIPGRIVLRISKD
jgi:alcohol dehydrogenase, propanol-preferring